MQLELQEIVGVILWWAEGSKSRRDKRWKNAWTYPVEVTNTDPRIIQLFLRLLRENIGVEEHRIKLQIQVHEGDDQAALEDFWSAATQIPKARFNKTIVRPVGNKIGKSRGTCKIRCSDKEIYGKLHTRLSEVLDNLTTQRGVAQSG